ncbi:zf-HC2 domain-containing protein [Edaphobacter modestus]|uniref:anti-sigma factor family protein n=1 Tax=Edaphobacter modestus TaxID=388466 RepID=UPI0013EEA162
MKDCGDCRENILLYLDKSLCISRAIEFRAHLEICEACRQVVEAEEELSHLLHRSRPLYSAPTTLREGILRATKGASPRDLPPQ